LAVYDLFNNGFGTIIGGDPLSVHHRMDSFLFEFSFPDGGISPFGRGYN
jgi:hypothetical protein